MMRHSFENVYFYTYVSGMEREVVREKNGLLIIILFLKVIADTEEVKKKTTNISSVYLLISVFKIRCFRTHSNKT